MGEQQAGGSVSVNKFVLPWESLRQGFEDFRQWIKDLWYRNAAEAARMNLERAFDLLRKAREGGVPYRELAPYWKRLLHDFIPPPVSVQNPRRKDRRKDRRSLACLSAKFRRRHRSKRFHPSDTKPC